MFTLERCISPVMLNENCLCVCDFLFCRDAVDLTVVCLAVLASGEALLDVK